MSSSFLGASTVRRQDSEEANAKLRRQNSIRLARRDSSLTEAAATPTSLAHTLSEVNLSGAPAGAPILRRAASSASTAPHSATFEGTFSFGVCDHVGDIYDLGRVARTSSTLLHEVRALDRAWMRACLVASAHFEWLEAEERLFDGSLPTWHHTFGVVMECRDRLVNRGHATGGLWGPSMAQAHGDGRCETLHWGSTGVDEVWTRAPPSPPERTVRDAFAQLILESEDWLNGARDKSMTCLDQSDTFPVFVATYVRKADGAPAVFDLPGEPAHAGLELAEAGLLPRELLPQLAAAAELLHLE